jgi:hypothetical protein
MSKSVETDKLPLEARLSGLEREYALRYEYIERRLDEGSKKFLRIENILWGLYGLVSVAVAYIKFI